MYPYKEKQAAIGKKWSICVCVSLFTFDDILLINNNFNKGNKTDEI